MFSALFTLFQIIIGVVVGIIGLISIYVLLFDERFYG
jgi:hypothetical protein